jgi:hypothetical protein
MVTKEMLEKLDHRKQITFAVFCARQVIHLVADEHRKACLDAIEAAEGFVEGRTTREECRAAAGAAYAAGYAAGAAYAGYAAAAAGYAAAYAAYAAANAADADKQAIELEQIRYYNELLNFDKIVEEALGV